MMKLIFFMMSLIILTFYMKKYFLNLIINYLFIMILLFFNNNFFLNYYWIKINYILGFDNISFSLLILMLWIMVLAMYSYNFNNYNNKIFINIMIFLIIIMIMVFCSMNLMIFYIFFEISLIPIILIIMGWGYQIDRIQASMYMFFYTLFGSLPLLIMIMYMYKYFNFIMMNNMWLKNFNNINDLFMFLILNMAFFIKMPMYLTHLWLPKAHVEAPISGSMILAGIMLKLGSYGIYRSMMIFPKMIFSFNLYMIIICLMGSFLMSLVCLNQSDLKIIVAYSSVVHMSILLASMFTLYKMSFKGSLMMMIAHGLCSSGMFFLVNLNYERLKSRNTLINKNLIYIWPSLTLWWFLICSSNFSAPPSLNLFSEFFMFNSLIQWNKYMIMLIIMISFFSTCYSIFLYSYSQYGKMNFYYFNFKFINCKEFLIIILHWVPLNLLFLNLNLFIYLKINLINSNYKFKLFLLL